MQLGPRAYTLANLIDEPNCLAHCLQACARGLGSLLWSYVEQSLLSELWTGDGTSSPSMPRGGITPRKQQQGWSLRTPVFGSRVAMVTWFESSTLPAALPVQDRIFG